MGALNSAVRIRHDLHSRLTEARKRTDELFKIVREEAIYDRPIEERHRIIFYVGHVESFDWNLLAQRAFGLQSFNEQFDKLFAFGIDPVGGGSAEPISLRTGRSARRSMRITAAFARNWIDAIARTLANPSGGASLIALDAGSRDRASTDARRNAGVHAASIAGEPKSAGAEGAGVEDRAGEIAPGRYSRGNGDARTEARKQRANLVGTTSLTDLRLSFRDSRSTRTT